MNFDFELFLVIVVLLSGSVWLVDKLWLKSQRQQAQKKEPWWVEYPRSFFPVLLAVLLLRSFLVEPFRIPSGSMFPTLLIGDFILANKFEYGLRLPVLRTEILPVGEPKRGDVVVFRYPEESALQACEANITCFEQNGMQEVQRSKGEDYIKRIIGLPGDVIRYQGDQLWVNGVQVRHETLGLYQGDASGRMPPGTERWLEYLPSSDGEIVQHEILTVPGVADRVPAGTITVPPGHYFMMGDNRDDSFDSRYWGPVPSRNLTGKAFLIWMNWDFQDSSMALGRIGTAIH